MDESGEVAKEWAGDSSVSGVAGRLEAIRRVIDECFVTAGRALTQAIDGAANLTTSFETLSITFNEKIVATTTADLRVAAAKLCTLPACHAHHCQNLSQLNILRDAFLRNVSDMRCTLASLLSYALQAKAVNGSTAREGEKLSAITACVTQGNEIINALEQDLAILRRDLGSAATQGETLGHQIAELIPIVPDELTNDANTLGEQYKKIVAIAEAATQIAHRLHGCVGRILEALQIGDITRQRVEHVQICVTLMEIWADGLPDDSGRRALATGYALMAAQLVDIEEEFRSEVDAMMRSMKLMDDDARVLLRLHGEAFAREGGEGAGFLHRLSARVGAAIKQVEAIEEVDLAAIATGRTTMRTARNLSVHVNGLRDLHHVIGEAAAKSVEHSDKAEAENFEHLVTAATATLDALLKLIDPLATYGMDRPAMASSGEAAVEALIVAAGRLREARDLTESNIIGITEKGNAVHNMLDLFAERLSFRETIEDILVSAARHASSLAEDAYACGENLHADLPELFASLFSHYTMARERLIHRRFLERLGIMDGASEVRDIADDANGVFF